MCYALKYGIWNVAQPQQEAVNALAGAGYAPLLSMVLSSRGIRTPQEAQNYLSCACSLPDPYLMTDMAPAVQRLRIALEKNEKIAVFSIENAEEKWNMCGFHITYPDILKPVVAMKEDNIVKNKLIFTIT